MPLDTYLARLVRKASRRHLRSGRRPEESQGIVKREIVRVVSPGTLTGFAAPRRARARVSPVAVRGVDPLAKVPPAAGVRPLNVGVALLDLTTGEFSCAEYAGKAGLQALADEVMVLRPREIVAPPGPDPKAPLRRGGRSVAHAPSRAVDG